MVGDSTTPFMQEDHKSTDENVTAAIHTIRSGESSWLRPTHLSRPQDCLGLKGEMKERVMYYLGLDEAENALFDGNMCWSVAAPMVSDDQDGEVKYCYMAAA